MVTIAASHSIFPPGSGLVSRNSLDRKETNSLLRKCKNFEQIRQFHAKIIRNSQLDDPFVVFELLRICSNLNSMTYAAKVFEQTERRNVFLYTALIDGFVLSKSYLDGIYIYCRMVSEDIVPDEYAITSVLKACGFQLALKEGRAVHNQVLKFGFSSNRLIRMKLMELYGKCGEFKDALKMFEEMPEDVVAVTIMVNSYMKHGLVEDANIVFDQIQTRDTVCWTALIDGLVRNGELNRALEKFREMQRQNVRPNEVTIVCVLVACSQLGALELGKWAHSYVVNNRINLNRFVGGALINMYARCGEIDEAQRVFDAMEERDITTYNSLIAGLAVHGRSVEAIELFQRLLKQHLKPNSITFVAILNACSHGGILELGSELFHSMKQDFGIEPQVEHYGCMVDLLGRVGQLEEAYSLIRRMEKEPDHIMLGALLSACKIHGNFKLGENVAKSLVECREADSGTYILLSNVYASWGRWKEAAELRAKMKENGIQKEPGCSSIEVNNEIHEFLLGDVRHPQKEDIYRKLSELNQVLKLHGYSPETGEVLHDMEDHEKELALTMHSERLAICYGLISTQANTTIRIVKNLRVCNDCHSAIKLIAKVTKRKIIVRDRNRFHHFENGDCSCRDYW